MTLPPLRNRIVGHADVDPRSLTPHPLNHRLHPAAQQQAMEAALAEIGVVARILVSKRTNIILNGHLRVELAIERAAATVSVVYADLSPDEELLVLTTFDRLAALAQTDANRLAALLHEVEVQEPALQALLDEYGTAYGVTAPDDSELPELPGGRPEPAPKDTAVIKVGTYRILVPLARYTAWLNACMSEHGDGEAALVVAWKRRLRLTASA